MTASSVSGCDTDEKRYAYLGSAVRGLASSAPRTPRRDHRVSDSGSTDGTRDLAREWADQVVDVPPSEFDHGLTRNLGIAASTGEFVALLVQDAVPESSDLLAELTRPLVADPDVAGVFACQLPRPRCESHLSALSLALGRGQRSRACGAIDGPC